ncbi:MAG: VWA domain-containing protein [Candidatus Riflebacteria bacterium]|nr:VWA domain-containing protein [Candidatus Riflebacteria bacterium]
MTKIGVAMTRCIALVALVTLVPVAAHAEGLSTRLSRIDAGTFPRIGVSLSVFSDGKPVPGLTKDAFTLDEDGKPVTIVSVDVEKAPLNVTLVLDTSGSMQPHLEALKTAVLDFVRGLDTQDRVSVVTFADEPTVREHLTGNRRRVKEIVEELRAVGATALYDAILASVKELKGVSGRRIAVIFSDGKDQNATGTAPQSVYSVKNAAQEAKDAQVALWTIAFGAGTDRPLLAKLAQVTGGQSYAPDEAGQLRQAFGRVLTDVRLQYRIEYDSPRPQPDGTERVLTVTSSARGRSGQGKSRYLAPAAPPTTGPPPAAGADASTVTSTTSMVAAMASLTFRGFPGGWANVWPPGMERTEAKKQHLLLDLYVPRRSEKTLSVRPGSWRIAWRSHLSHEFAVLGDVELKAGEERIVVSPFAERQPPPKPPVKRVRPR